MTSRQSDTLYEDDDELQLEEERRRKIEEFEAFINERLKVDLDKTLTLRDKVYADLSHYLDLRNTILTIKEQNLKEMTTMVNLGSEFYVQAKVPDTSRIFVNIGLGFHAEMTLDEALKFISVKEEQLNKQADMYTKSANDIKIQIRVMYQHLEQLMNLPQYTPPSRRDIF